MRSSLARLDSLYLVDYSRFRGPVKNVGGDHSDISAYDADYFHPFADKHNHIRLEDMEPAGLKGTMIPSATTIGTFLILMSSLLYFVKVLVSQTVSVVNIGTAAVNLPLPMPATLAKMGNFQ